MLTVNTGSRIDKVKYVCKDHEVKIKKQIGLKNHGIAVNRENTTFVAMDPMFENKETMPISEIGEFGLIDHLTNGIELSQKSSVLGVGDDAAIIDTGGPNYTVVSTDMLIENVHFDMMYTPLKHLGYKAAVVNFSDICAMNGTPKQLLISIGLSSRFTLDAVEEIYAGIRLACEKYGVDLVGGDTTSSRMGLVINGTAIGDVPKDKLVKRSGAQPGDLVCVTGDLGSAYFGLQLLEREKAVYLENPEMQPDLSGHDYIIERQLKPEARVDMVKALDKMGVVPTSMIDISDGLASELLHIAKASDVGVTVYENKIPVDHDAVQMGIDFNIDATTGIMNGGEDYELLFTLPQSAYEKVQNDKDITIIGYVTEKSQGNNMITNGEQKVELKAQGWTSF